MIWYSQVYDFDIVDQFNRRIARTGQTQPVTIRRLMVPESADWAISENLRKKERGQNELLKNLKLLAQTR